MRRFPALFLMLVLSSLVAAGIAESQTPVSGGSELRYPEIGYKRLLNGLQVVIASTPHLGEEMTIGLVVHYGSVFDPSDKGGLAHVLSRMFMKATQDRTAQDIRSELEYLGGSLEVRNDWDSIRFTLRCRSPHFERSLLLLYQVVGEAVFSEEDFAAVQEEVLLRLKEPGDPRQQARIHFENALFQGTSYGRPLQGTPASVANITAGDVRYFYRRFFSPNSASLTIVGAAPPELVQQKATRIWGVWVRREEVPFSFLPPRNPATRTIVLEDDSSPAVQFVLGNLWPRREEPGYISGTIASVILQERMTQALPTSLISVVAEGRRMPGPFFVHGQAAVDQAGKEIRRVIGVVEEFKGSSASDSELEAAKRKRSEDLRKSLATTDGICSLLMDIELYRLGTNYIPAFSDLLARVTPASVREAAKEWTFPAGILIYVRGPAEPLRADLNSLGTLQVFP